MANLGYEHVSLVQGIGDFSVRGGIVDTFPPGHDRITSYNVCYTKLLRALHKFGLETAPDASYAAVGSLTRFGENISIDIKVYDLLDPSSQTFYYLDGQKLENVKESISKIIKEVLSRNNFV